MEPIEKNRFENRIPLEPDSEQRLQWLDLLKEIVSDFHVDLEQQPVFEERKGHVSVALTDSSQSLESVLGRLVDAMQSHGLQASAGGHLAYIPGGGLNIAAIADYIAAMVNDFTGDRRTSPIGVAIHDEVLRWCADKMGFEGPYWGDITSGGTQATLRAMVAARDAMGLEPKNYHQHVIYITEHSHHCVLRAVGVAFGNGLTVRQIRTSGYRMDAAALEQQIKNDKGNGLVPFMVVASAGTTNLGRVDPISALADLRDRYGFWLHLDGAYGGFFRLAEPPIAALGDTGRADSIILDPHKSLFLPYGCGVLLVKGNGQVEQNPREKKQGKYLQDRGEGENLSPMDYSLEITRPFRALRIWLALQIHGIEAFREALSEKLDLARSACQLLGGVEGLEIVAKPELSVFAFAVQGDTDGNKTRSLLRYLNQSGDVFLSSTQIGQRFVIRVAVLSHRTKAEHIDALVSLTSRYMGELQ